MAVRGEAGGNTHALVGDTREEPIEPVHRERVALHARDVAPSTPSKVTYLHRDGGVRTDLSHKMLWGDAVRVFSSEPLGASVSTEPLDLLALLQRSCVAVHTTTAARDQARHVRNQRIRELRESDPGEWTLVKLAEVTGLSFGYVAKILQDAT